MNPAKSKRLIQFDCSEHFGQFSTAVPLYITLEYIGIHFQSCYDFETDSLSYVDRPTNKPF